MNRRRSLFVALAAVLLLGPVLSLSRPTAAQDRPVLRFGVNAADLSTLDPHYASGTQDRTVVDMVFNALVRFAPGNAPQIAGPRALLTRGTPSPIRWSSSYQMPSANRRG